MVVTFEAIAATSKTLYNLLRDKLKRTDVGITALHPETKSDLTKRINLYLYQIEENKHLKNDDNSRLWLNLFYLVTPFDNSSSNNGFDGIDVQTQIILGDAMRVFHDYPIIHPSLSPETGAVDEILDRRLKDSIEKIKITPQPMSLDDLSKIWTSIKGDLKLSVVYQISVVQIDSLKGKRYPAPVLSRNIDVIPLKSPFIKEISPHIACINDELKISGRNFFSDRTVVKIGDMECTPLSFTDEQILSAIPSNLSPGPQ